jgi:nitric oxide reductase NorD protein
MAEPEEVVTDVARHATVFVRDLWRRHHGRKGITPTTGLADVAPRVDLLITSVFGRSFSIRVAEPPAPPTLLTTFFGRRRGPVQRQPIPATDGVCLWLPADLGLTDPALALERYRVMALQQAMRAERGGAALIAAERSPVVQEFFLLLEVCAADTALQRWLPGTAAQINAARRAALATRPALYAFPGYAQPLERFVRRLIQSDCAAPDSGFESASAVESLGKARRMAADLVPRGMSARARRSTLLFKDRWTGEFRAPPEDTGPSAVDPESRFEDPAAPHPRATRIERRPRIRQPEEDEDRDAGRTGAWMVQTDEPHQKAEDPMGLQRPADRDQLDRADEMGDMLSELRQARTVSTPGRPKEVLLSDDPPDSRTKLASCQAEVEEHAIRYPEWDYRTESYREPGASVRMVAALSGPQAWVDETLERHRGMLALIRRRFELLHARRVTLRRQAEGEEVDLDACVEAIADFRAGVRMPDALYQTCRPFERNLAILLLIDASGSTDGWISSHRRIIDVEREALLLVCIALKELGEPYAVQAFSGEGPQGVTVREIKRFDEAFDSDVALRIAALEPERYTRAGAALRHATAALMQRPANHRLLLLLSDGKPNDVDQYQGRYGVEDMQRAVSEAKLMGIFPFCLTIDRQAANYLPRIFGPNQYAMLPRPERLPTVLLDWMRRLVHRPL